MTITISKLFQFDYGHRVLGHEGKCRHLHGHRGAAWVRVTAPELNELGMVIDFGIIKEKVGQWIDEFWDHNMILSYLDPLLRIDKEEVWQGKAPYIMSDNPTAENMARNLFNIANSLLEIHSITVVSVRLYETPSSFADYCESPR